MNITSLLDDVMHHYKFHTVIMNSDKKFVWK